MSRVYHGGADRDDLSFGPFDSDPGLDDVVAVEVATGVVHQGMCDRPRGSLAPWSHDVAGERDRPCPSCLPEGLPS